MSLTYHVSRVVPRWLGGVGDLCGVLVTLVEFSATGEDMSARAVAESVARAIESTEGKASGWVVFSGDERQFDNEVFTHVRIAGRCKVAVEVSGLLPLNARTRDTDEDRCPLYDHVCVRASLPFGATPNPLAKPLPMRVQKLDSVVAYGRVTPRTLAGMDEALRPYGFEGRKYVEVEDDAVKTAATVAAHGRGWRVTRPMAPRV